MQSCSDSISGIPSDYLPYFARLDSNGNLKWRIFFQKDDENIIRQSRELIDGTILLAGETRNDADARYIGWLLKLDADGNIIWERKPEYNHPNRPFQGICAIWDFQQTADSGFICAGSAFGDGNESDFWFLKLDSMGCEISGCYLGIENTKATIGEVVIMPNPASTKVLVSIKSNKQAHAYKEAVFKLYDVSGKEIYTQTSTLNTSAYSEYYLNTAAFQSGIYFYIVSVGSEVIGKGKLVRE